MHKLLVLILLTILPTGYLSLKGSGVQPVPEIDTYQLYMEMELRGVVDFMPFSQAMEGYRRIEGLRKPIVTIIDFTKPSTAERLFVIDLARQQLLYRSLVAHGKGSGDTYATSFSNTNGSHKSSLGFYLTGDTYDSRTNGYSLVLEGLDKGFNDQARERSIVVHGADYCDPDFMVSAGRLGRSLGCPAIPLALTHTIIDAIKNGSLLYIYANNAGYLSHSTVLSKADPNKTLL